MHAIDSDDQVTFPGLRVLVVDDEEEKRTIVVKALNDQHSGLWPGCPVDEEYCVTLGQKRALSEKYDVAVVDLKLDPPKDGAEKPDLDTWLDVDPNPPDGNRSSAGLFVVFALFASFIQRRDLLQPLIVIYSAYGTNNDLFRPFTTKHYSQASFPQSALGGPSALGRPFVMAEWDRAGVENDTRIVAALQDAERTRFSALRDIFTTGNAVSELKHFNQSKSVPWLAVIDQLDNLSLGSGYRLAEVFPVSFARLHAPPSGTRADEYNFLIEMLEMPSAADRLASLFNRQDEHRAIEAGIGDYLLHYTEPEDRPAEMRTDGDLWYCFWREFLSLPSETRKHMLAGDPDNGFPGLMPDNSRSIDWRFKIGVHRPVWDILEIEWFDWMIKTEKRFKDAWRNWNPGAEDKMTSCRLISKWVCKAVGPTINFVSGESVNFSSDKEGNKSGTVHWSDYRSIGKALAHYVSHEVSAPSSTGVSDIDMQFSYGRFKGNRCLFIDLWDNGHGCANTIDKSSNPWERLAVSLVPWVDDVIVTDIDSKKCRTARHRSKSELPDVCVPQLPPSGTWVRLVIFNRAPET